MPLDECASTVSMDENATTLAPETEVDEGGAPPSSFYSQPYPRINVWKETITLLRDTGVPDTVNDAVGFANNAIQVVLRRGGHLADLNDVIALGVALDARAKEMNAILLDVAVVANDLVFLSEFSAVLGPFRDEIRKDLAR